MCGRFTVTATADELLNRFGVVINSNLKPRWNVAPSQKSPSLALMALRVIAICLILVLRA